MPKRRRLLAVLATMLLPACQKTGSAPAPTFAIAPQAASLTVRFTPSAGYRATYLEPRNWDTATGILTNADPAIASSTVSVQASGSGGALSATLSFASIKPASGYTLQVELLNTHSAQPTVIASETQSAIALTPGANTLTLGEPQATPSLAPTQAFGPYVVSLPGYGTPGRLANAQDLAVDAKGRTFVLDNGRLRLIQPDAAGRLSISTLAGRDSTSLAGLPGQGVAGFTDGPGETALFDNPRRLAIAPDGTLYIADTGNNAIRKVTLDAHDHATVSTLAGNGAAGLADGQGSSATFRSPQGIAVDGQGNVYVADTGNSLIRMVSPTGLVSTVGGTGRPGFQDGAGSTAEFNEPEALTLDAQGRLWVADTVNACLRLITKDSSGNTYTVSTVAGDGNPGEVDGIGTNAEFGGQMSDLAFTPSGSLDVFDGALRQVKFDASGTATVSTLVSSALSDAAIVGRAAVSNAHPALAMAADGNPLVLSPRTIIEAAPDASGSAQLKTLFGDKNMTATSATDGPSASNYDFGPEDLAVDRRTGDVYVATSGNQIMEIPAGKPDQTPVLVAGDGTNGDVDGTGSTAELDAPDDVAIASDGTLYTAEVNSGVIRRVAKDSSGQYVVSTFAGIQGITGYQDGPASSAKFSFPFFVVQGPDGNLYVADQGNNMVRKITIDGQHPAMVSTLVGSLQGGLVDGLASNARLNGPTGLAFDQAGDLIIADARNCCIRKVTFDANGNAATVSTVAGSGRAGTRDGIAGAAQFNAPNEVSVTPNGDIYVIDGTRVRRISLNAGGQAVVTTVAGNDKGYADGPGASARFGDLAGMMVDNQGNVLLADLDNWVIRELVP